MAHEVGGDRQEDGRLAPRPRRHPQIGVRGRVGQAEVEHRYLGAVLLGLHDPLGVRVEVVAGLEVAGEQQDRLGVAVVRRGPVEAHPVGVAGAPAAGADVGVAVVAVDAPRLEDPLGEAVLAGPPDVVHHLVHPAIDDGLPDPAADVLEDLVPGDLLELARPSLTDPAQRVEDPLGVGDLVDGGGALGTVAAPRARVGGVALELADREVLVVDVGQQAARGLAVEADGRDEHVVARLAGLRVVLRVPVPLLGRRVVAKPPPAALARKRYAAQRRLGVLLDGHDSGTSWPARTKTCSYMSRATWARAPPTAPSQSVPVTSPTRANTAVRAAIPMLVWRAWP